MSNRRDFLKKLTLAGVATSSLTQVVNAVSKKKRQKLNLLILGGTGFLGPHTVNAALAQGHQVTLFNRGKTNPHLFPELEKIKGDRNTQDIEKLSGRKFDAVIDTSAYFPRSVKMALNVLKANIKQYLLVSTISVYRDWSVPDMDETSPVGTLQDPSVEKITGETYGPLKALCEKEAERLMPGKVSIIRPGLIVGPGDKTDRFTYWPARVNQGGNILAPGNGKDFIQYIDVRDLAEWMVYCLDSQVTGVYNAQTNGRDITMKQLLDSCVKNINPQAKLTWVDSEFLTDNQVVPWSEMPVWIPAKGEYAGSGTMSSKKAYANGLKQRSMDTVVNDCFQWFSSLPEARQKKLRAGISRDKETKVLNLWKSTQQKS